MKKMTHNFRVFFPFITWVTKQMTVNMKTGYKDAS